MKLSSDTSVLCLTHEGITNFASLSDFCKKSIDDFTRVFKSIIPAIEVDDRNIITAKDSVCGANIPQSR